MTPDIKFRNGTQFKENTTGKILTITDVWFTYDSEKRRLLLVELDDDSVVTADGLEEAYASQVISIVD